MKSEIGRGKWYFIATNTYTTRNNNVFLIY